MSTRFKGFVGQSYLLRNIRFDCQRTVNLYPEVDESGMGKNAEIAQLTRTAGLTQLVAGIGHAGKALYLCSSTGVLFMVATDGLYTITGADGTSIGWSATKVATFAPSGPVKVTDNGATLFVTDNGHGWAINMTTWAVTSITNVAPTSCTFLDGFVLFSDQNSNKFYWTGLYTNTVDVLDFASAEANPDNIVAIFNNNEDLWVFGNKTTELWYNSGPTASTGIGSNTTFSRRPSVLVETGCAAVGTISKVTQNRIMWLASDDRGGPTVVLAEGYTPTRVSTYALEQQLSGLSDASIRAATACVRVQDGHIFYVLNIPGLESTWVYDLTTSMQLQQPTWHEETWTNPSTGVQSRHRAEGHALYLNKHVVLDYETGAVYFLDQDAYSDNGDNITRMRVTPHVSNDGKRLFYNWLQIDMKTGIGTAEYPNPTVMLEYSNDGGNTWSNVTSTGAGRAGALGSYSTRVIFHQLGQARDRVFRLTMTDPVDWALSGAAIDITPAGW